MRPVAQALAYAHGRGVVHRDLTPSNILIERGAGRVVTTDFGLARIARSTGSLTATGVLLGTPSTGLGLALGRENGAAADLYALGCILFLLLSGRLPFEGRGSPCGGPASRTRRRAVAAVVAPGWAHPSRRSSTPCSRATRNDVRMPPTWPKSLVRSPTPQAACSGVAVGASALDEQTVALLSEQPTTHLSRHRRAIDPAPPPERGCGVDATALVGAATRGHRSRRVGCGRRRRTRCRGRGAESAPACAKRRVAARRRGTRQIEGSMPAATVSVERIYSTRVGAGFVIRQQPQARSPFPIGTPGAPLSSARLLVRAGAGRSPAARPRRRKHRSPVRDSRAGTRTHFLGGTQRVGGRAAATP